MDFFDRLFIGTLAVGALGVFFMLISAVFRFSNQSASAKHALNISGGLVIVSIFILVGKIGFNGIDPGFLSFCIGLELLAVSLLVANNKSKRQSED